MIASCAIEYDNPVPTVSDTLPVAIDNVSVLVV
jgi:hypothetical protein